MSRAAERRGSPAVPPLPPSTSQHGDFRIASARFADRGNRASKVCLFPVYLPFALSQPGYNKFRSSLIKDRFKKLSYRGGTPGGMGRDRDGGVFF